MKRIVSIFLCLMLVMCSVAFPVLASEYGDGDPSSELYPDDMPALFVEHGIVITSQPKSVTAVKGSTVEFTVVASGEGLTYQWQWWKAEINAWTNTTVSGNTTASISVEATEARNGYQYRCLVSNSLGYVVSDPVMLTVITSPVQDNSFTFQEVLGLFDAAAGAVVGWFSQIMDSTGAGNLYIAMMSVVLSVAILLGPLLGSARSGLSDVVHKPRQKKEKEDE